MSYKTEKVNKFKVKPFVNTLPTENFRGSDIFDRPYWNMALLSKTSSGKTTVIGNLLKKFAGPQTVVLIFSSTYEHDPTYKAIFDELDKRGIPHMEFNHFIDEDRNNLIPGLLSSIASEDKEDLEEEEEKPTLQLIRKNDQPVKKPKKKKKKLLNYIWVFDDLSKDLRNPSVSKLMKKARHYRSKVILSSQDIKDITPDCHAQLYAVILFSGLSEERLASVYKCIAMDVDKHDFEKLYRDVTSKPYTFLTVLPMKGEFRRNLNERINIKDDSESETESVE